MAFLAWPAAVVVIGIFALVFFKAPIIRFIDRTKRVSRGGIESDVVPQDAGAGLVKSKTSELLDTVSIPMVSARADKIREDLKMRGVNAADREELLIRSVAALQYRLMFELAYSRIWGSQIRLLQALNPHGEPGVAEASARPEYAAAAAANPDVYETYSFDEWLGYLADIQFVIRKPGHVAISIEGREFLRYLAEVGHRLDKIL